MHSLEAQYVNKKWHEVVQFEVKVEEIQGKEIVCISQKTLREVAHYAFGHEKMDQENFPTLYALLHL